MKRVVLALVLALASCAAPARAPLPDASLVPVMDPAHPVSLSRLLSSSRLSVVVFFSAHCACQRAHDVRLIELYRRYAASGVQFLAVDSEVDATAASDAKEAEARGYPFSLYLDPGAKLAAAAGAEFATYSLLLDARGDVIYRGGIDSDRNALTADATAHLADAIRAALDAEPPPEPARPALGCALRTQ